MPGANLSLHEAAFVDLEECVHAKTAVFGGIAPPNTVAFPKLLSQTQLSNQGTIALDVGLLEVVQQTATLTNHQQQTATAVVILLVELEVLVQVVDAFGQQSDLNLRGTGVTFVISDFSMVGLPP